MANPLKLSAAVLKELTFSIFSIITPLILCSLFIWATSISNWEYTDTNCPIAMLHTPTTRPAKPESSMAFASSSTTPTTIIKKEVKTSSSFAPRMAARSYCCELLASSPFGIELSTPSIVSLVSLRAIKTYLFMARNDTKLTIDGVESSIPKSEDANNSQQRRQWLRAAILGANDGLVSTSSLMMGVGAVEDDANAILLLDFAGHVAEACSRAIEEFISVYSQLDIKMAQMKREQRIKDGGEDQDGLRSPVRAAVSSAVAFSTGAMVSLLAAGFISSRNVRLGVMATATTVVLVVFGSVGTLLGQATMARSAVRVLVGGWMAKTFNFAVTKIFGFTAL